MYGEKIQDISHLWERIVAAGGTVTPDTLLNSWREVKYRLEVCRATNGSHVEAY